jgi:glycosyltransferase involved in cell wall biosynthesis
MAECTVALISAYARSLANFRGPLISDVVKKGARVFALAPDYDEDTRSAVPRLGGEAHDITLSRTGLNPARDIFDCFQLTRVLRRLRPDVSLAYYIKPVIYGTIAASLARVPLRVALIEGLGSLFTMEGTTDPAAKRVLRLLAKKLYRFALKRTHKAVFLNRDDAREFVDWGLVNAGKVVVLGGIGVDLDEWQFKPPVVTPISFVFVGRLLREKGLLDLVSAARMVKSTCPVVRFFILGEGDRKEGAIGGDQMRAWVAEGIFTWPGQVDVKSWLEKSSVFVLPSFREGVPRSTQEAMAMGRPIITTDVPGCRETVEDGVNGFLVPVRDPRALAEAMMRFVRHPDLIAPMGQQSRRMAEERFDVRIANKKLLAILGIENPKV